MIQRPATETRGDLQPIGIDILQATLLPLQAGTLHSVAGLPGMTVACPPWPSSKSSRGGTDGTAAAQHQGV